MGNVGSGAEVCADGDIHVYGRLNGRALAGLAGDSRAMVFAQRFDPELLSIADVFTAIEDPGEWGVQLDKPTISYLEDGQLRLNSF
jgi:septum site-determining protein MinC